MFVLQRYFHGGAQATAVRPTGNGLRWSIHRLCYIRRLDASNYAPGVYIRHNVNRTAEICCQWAANMEKQEAVEKCWAHSPLRAAARRLF